MPDTGEKRRKKKRQTPSHIKDMRQIMEKALAGGDPARVQAQKAKGKLTARERIHYLLDEDTFQETGLLVKTRCHDFGLQDKNIPGDGVITGFGRIAGREVCVFSQDFTVLGGSLGLAHAKKICRIMDLAYENRVPVIGLLDSGGARIQEGVDSLDGYAEIFYRNVKCSGIVPQISVILGPCAGGAVYSPALTDFVFMVDGISNMYVTGPAVVKAATGEEVSFEELGGGRTHCEKSGVAHFLANSEPDCFRRVRELLSYLPSHRGEKPARVANPDPVRRTTPLLETMSQVDPRKPYRINHVIWHIADEHKFFEVMKNFAKNIVIGFMRLGGDVVGVVANNPAHKAGALDIDASDKAARFIRFLNAFNIPIVTFVDVPGYWPGVEQEHGGIIRKGAKLLYAYCQATVPKLTVILRKAYGGAYDVMSSKHVRGDMNYAWPGAEIAVMGPQGAVNILFAREIRKAAKPGERREELVDEYTANFANPLLAAQRGYIDEVIEPKKTRHKLIRALRFLRNKKTVRVEKKHGNIPL